MRSWITSLALTPLPSQAKHQNVNKCKRNYYFLKMNFAISVIFKWQFSSIKYDYNVVNQYLTNRSFNFFFSLPSLCICCHCDVLGLHVFGVVLTHSARVLTGYRILYLWNLHTSDRILKITYAVLDIPGSRVAETVRDMGGTWGWSL